MKKLSLEELSKLSEESLIIYISEIQNLSDRNRAEFISKFSYEERLGYVKIFLDYADRNVDKVIGYSKSKSDKLRLENHYVTFGIDSSSKLN